MKQFLSQLRLIAIIASIIGLSACARLQSTAAFSQVPAKQRAALLSQLQYWKITGSFSVNHANKVHIAQYQWQQAGRQRYQIHINSALNIVQLSIYASPGKVSLWRSATDHAQATSATQLMRRELGWSLPLTNLQYWVLGLPAPSSKGIPTYDHFGHLVALRQQGWRMTFQRYRNVDGIDLPGLILLQRPDTAIHLAVTSWTFDAYKPVS